MQDIELARRSQRVSQQPVQPVGLFASPGKRGIAGPKGERGERGAKGDPGLSGATICDWKIDRARYLATPLMSDGCQGPPLELRELFQQFLTEAG